MRRLAGWLLVLLGLAAGGVSAVAGAVGLFASRTPWPWAAVVVPEMAGWAALPALVGAGLAAVAGRVGWPARGPEAGDATVPRASRRRWSIATRPVPRTVAGLCLAAAALAGWPLVALPFAAARFHQTMRQALGPAYPDALAAPSGAAPRPAAFSLRDYLRGIPLGPSRSERDLVYRTLEGEELALDLYHPSTPGPHPLVVAIHGGGWSEGDRGEAPPFNRYLAARGYAVAAIDYRLAPAWTYPAHLEDVQAAVAFLAERAAAYDLDPSRLILLGRSAGGHLALLAGYSTDAGTLGGARVVGIVAYYAPTDLAALARYPCDERPVDLRQLTAQFLGADVDAAPELFARASPTTYADRSVPPTLLVHGARDEIVPVDQAHRLAARLAAAGNTAAYLELPWSAHGFDAAFHGLGHQLFLYELDRFLAWATAPGGRQQAAR